MIITNTSRRAAIMYVAASDSAGHALRAADYIGDGAADDVAISAAIARLSTTGGKIWCAAGNYVCKGQILIPSNITVEFETGNTVKLSDAHTLDDNPIDIGEGIEYTALFINQHAAGLGNTNIHIINANIDFEAGPGTSKFDEDKNYAGIWLDKCSYSSVKRSVANNVVYDTDNTAGLRAFGILLTDCTDSVVRTCRADGAGYEGIGIRGACRRVLVDNCIANGCKVHAMQAAVITNLTTSGLPQHVTFRNCYSLDGDIIFHGSNTEDTETDAFDLTVDSCITPLVAIYGHLSRIKVRGCTLNYVQAKTLSMTGVTAHTIQNLIITGNTFNETSVAKVQLYATNTLASVIKNVVVANNNMPNTPGASLDILSTGAVGHIVRDVIVSGNTMETINPVTTSGTVACRIVNSSTGTWERINFDGNIFTGTLYGATPVTRPLEINCQSSGSVKHVRFSNNIANKDVRMLMYCNHSTGTGAVEYVDIDNNMLAAGAAYGLIQQTGANGALRHVRFNGNRIANCKYLLQNDSGTMEYIDIQPSNKIDNIETSLTNGTIGSLTYIPTTDPEDGVTIWSDNGVLKVSTKT